MSRTVAQFPIREDVADALKFAGQSRRDDLGYWYYTFRVRLEDSQMDGTTIVGQLVDAGWQLQGGPVLVEASDTHPRHIIVSMLHAEPHRRRHTIKKAEVKQRVKDWLSEGVAASTIRKRMTALSTLFEELDGDEAFNPVKGVKRPKEPEAQPDFRSPDVILAVLEALARRTVQNNRGWKTLARALVLAYTGTRPSQIARLDPETHILPFLQAATPMVHVPAGKGGRAHWKPLPPGGVAAFRLFVNSRAQGKFSTSSFYKSWMQACDDADVARFNPYKLRHSYATLMRRAGADVADIQELLGHKSAKTTQRYTAVIPEKLADAARQFQSVWSKGRRFGVAVESPKRAVK